MESRALGTDGLRRVAGIRPRRLQWMAITVYSVSVLISVAFWLWVLRYALRLLQMD